MKVGCVHRPEGKANELFAGHRSFRFTKASRRRIVEPCSSLTEDAPCVRGWPKAVTGSTGNPGRNPWLAEADSLLSVQIGNLWRQAEVLRRKLPKELYRPLGKITSRMDGGTGANPNEARQEGWGLRGADNRVGHPDRRVRPDDQRRDPGDGPSTSATSRGWWRFRATERNWSTT